MIGKLIKHDLIAGARRMGNIYLAAVIACAALLFSSLVKSGFLRFLSSAAVFVIACIAVVVTFASVVFGANKTLFGREGYLTQTLPVRTSSLIIFFLGAYKLRARGGCGYTAFRLLDKRKSGRRPNV